MQFHLPYFIILASVLYSRNCPYIRCIVFSSFRIIMRITPWYCDCFACHVQLPKRSSVTLHVTRSSSIRTFPPSFRGQRVMPERHREELLRRFTEALGASLEEGSQRHAARMVEMCCEILQVREISWKVYRWRIFKRKRIKISGVGYLKKRKKVRFEIFREKEARNFNYGIFKYFVEMRERNFRYERLVEKKFQVWNFSRIQRQEQFRCRIFVEMKRKNSQI